MQWTRLFVIYFTLSGKAETPESRRHCNQKWRLGVVLGRRRSRSNSAGGHERRRNRRRRSEVRHRQGPLASRDRRWRPIEGGLVPKRRRLLGSQTSVFFLALLFFVLLCVCARCKMDKVRKFGVLMVLRIVFFSSFGCRGLMLRLMGCWEGTGMSTRWTSRAAKASSSCSFQKGWVVNPQILWLWVNLSSALFFFGGVKL